MTSFAKVHSYIGFSAGIIVAARVHCGFTIRCLVRGGGNAKPIFTDNTK